MKKMMTLGLSRFTQKPAEMLASAVPSVTSTF